MKRAWTAAKNFVTNPVTKKAVKTTIDVAQNAPSVKEIPKQAAQNIISKVTALERGHKNVAGDLLNSAAEAYLALGGRDVIKKMVVEQFASLLGLSGLPKLVVDSLSPLIDATLDHWKDEYLRDPNAHVAEDDVSPYGTLGIEVAREIAKFLEDIIFANVPLPWYLQALYYVTRIDAVRDGLSSLTGLEHVVATPINLLQHWWMRHKVSKADREALEEIPWRKRRRTDPFIETEKEHWQTPEESTEMQHLFDDASFAYARTDFDDAMNKNQEDDLDELAARTLIQISHDSQPIVDQTSKLKEGFVEYDPNRGCVVISFKGTVTPEDLKEDAKAKPIAIIGVMGDPLPIELVLHSGFWDRFRNLYLSLKKGLEHVLKPLGYGLSKPTSPPIFITGHSLGGALATVCAVILTLLHPKWDIRLYTFEAPRSFQAATIRDLNAYVSTDKLFRKAKRIQVSGDWIPNVPNRGIPGLPSGYVHVGQKIVLPFYTSVGKEILLEPHMRTSIQDAMDVTNPTLTEEPWPVTYATGGRRISKRPKRGSRAAKIRMMYVRSFKHKK